MTPPRIDGEWQWTDLLGALDETLDLAKLRAVEPTQVDSTAYARFLPATAIAATSAACRSRQHSWVNDVNVFSSGAPMADRFAIVDIEAALEEKRHPTVISWNRLEGRPRTVNFERALRAEVRDALWMLTRQWQVGEFRGEDAGSPVFAKVHVATTRLTRFRPGSSEPQDFDDAMPLETLVERRPLRFAIGRDKVALDLRLTSAAGG